MIAISNADRLKRWFGKDAAHLCGLLRHAAGVQLLFGVGILVMTHTPSGAEAARWAKNPGVSLLTCTMFPGAQLVLDAGVD